MKTLIALTAAALIAVPARAQTSDEPTSGIHAGNVLVRLRAILVAPNESSSGITPTFPAEHAKLDNSVVPEVDVTYMATDHVGFELIAATSKHRASGITGTTGSIGQLASTWVLPPTLTAQYHFNPHGAVRPYVGAGVNYTIFYNEKASKGMASTVGPTQVGLSDSVGWAAQAGIDVDVSKRFFANLDIKYVDIDTIAHLQTRALGAERTRVHIGPIIAGIGFGIRL